MPPKKPQQSPKQAAASPKVEAKKVEAKKETPAPATPTPAPVATVPVAAPQSPSPAKGGKGKKEPTPAKAAPTPAAATPTPATTTPAAAASATTASPSPAKGGKKGKDATPAAAPSTAATTETDSKTTAAAAPVAAKKDKANKEKPKKDAAATSVTSSTSSETKSGATPVAAVGETYDTAHIFIAQAFPEWQQQVLKVMQQLYAAAPGKDYKDKTVEVKELSAALKATPGFNEPSQKKQLSNAMAFASTVVADVKQRGKDALELTMPFDEEKLLREHLDFITRDLGLKNVEIKVTTTEVAAAGGQATGAGVKPGQPAINFIASSSA